MLLRCCGREQPSDSIWETNPKRSRRNSAFENLWAQTAAGTHLGEKVPKDPPLQLLVCISNLPLKKAMLLSACGHERPPDPISEKSQKAPSAAAGVYLELPLCQQCFCDLVATN